MTKIKMCGLARSEDIEAANRILPEFIGFVFAPGRRRTVSPQTAARLRRNLAPQITAVGVFLDNDPEEIIRLAKSGTIDWVQLHGNEPEDLIPDLRRETGAVIIRAYRASDPGAAAAASRSCADYVLLDAGAGDGATFDWTLAKSVSRPFFLAGGLSPQNVEAAISEVHPWCVDVSSGIETDGLKDAIKMAEFAAAVRKERSNNG